MIKYPISTIKKKLTNPREDKIRLIASVMTDSTFEDLNSLYQHIPLLHRGLFALPYLRRKSYEEIFGRGYFIKNSSITGYIGTILFVLRLNKKYVDRYLELREKYENAFLLGHYEIAMRVLSEINSSVSYSVWAAEQEIKLERLSKGLTACSNKYNELRKTNPRLRFYTSYYFKTSSMDIPFDKDVELFNKVVRDPSIDEELGDAIINHTCSFLRNYKSTNWIVENSQSSLIDIYNSVRDNLWDIKISALEQETLNCIIKKWLEIFDDAIIGKYATLNGLITGVKGNKSRIEIIRSYYSKNYLTVINDGEKYLLVNPTDFAILDKLVKSLIQSKQKPHSIGTENCILEKLIFYYYNILSYTPNYRIYITKIYSILRSLYTFQCCRYLYEIVNNIKSETIINFTNESFKYSIYNEFEDVCFFNDIDSRLKYIEKNVPTEYSLVLRNIIEAKIKDDELYYLLHSETNEDDICNELLSAWKNEEIPHYLSSAVSSRLFNYYVNNSKWENAIIFYVDTKLHNLNLEIRYNKENLFKKVALEVNSDFSTPLIVSIFYTMLDYTPARKYLSYKHALKQLGVKKASEIVNVKDSKIRYFLQFVANKKVLGLHRIQFHTYDEVVEERIKICNTLYNTYQEKAVLNEISGLIKEQKVKKLIRKVDESRIYVDEEGIRTNELREQSSWFEVYKSTDDSVNIADNGIGVLLKILKETTLLNSNAKIITLNMAEDQASVNYKESLFKQLYLSIRDKFLLNAKFGLEFHLSTRIRHGSIINQLRRHFEQYSLVTNIGVDGKYSIDKYWSSQILSLNVEEQKKCQELLLLFTQSVDSSILKIKDEYIQIKTEDHNTEKSAVFNFSLDELAYEISILCQTCTDVDFDTCVSRIFDNLWLHTEKCIRELHHLIDIERDYLLTDLSRLNNDFIKVVNGDTKRIRELSTAITQCRTLLQRDFEIVHSWLQRRNTTSFEFTMQDVIDTCITVINSLNPKGLIFSETNHSNSKLSGLYFNYVYDILQNVLNNIQHYQKNKNIEVKCDIKVKEEANMLFINICNNINEEDLKMVKDSILLSERNCEPYVTSGKVSSEGKTGISKIFNIVKNILGNEKNYYNNIIDEEKCIVRTEICINIEKLRR